MSAPARALQDLTSATNVEHILPEFRAVNRIVDALRDLDLYESEDELKPSPQAIVAAAGALIALSPQDAESVEIEPYSGELSLIWRAGGNKRVKAMFGQERNSYSVYYERMAGGRVVECHLRPNADNSYLVDRLTWLHT